MSASPPEGAARGALLAALGVLAVLLATVDTRAFGLIPDGKEMLSVSAALARFGEIGISRDFANAPRRPVGDAVSRYGMGLSFVGAVPAAVAHATGARRTSPLFVLLPCLCLAGCAWAAARALGRLGLPDRPAGLFGAAVVLATPLWGYAASDYGEPLQALGVAVCALAAAALREEPASRRWQIVLGLAAGCAVLTKTLLAAVVAPLLVLAVFSRSTSEKKGSAARMASLWPLLLTFMGILSLWFSLEIIRFGKLGGGYAGETFTYPFFTGLLRLTLLPNKGLLWYAPIVVLAVPGFLVLRRRDARLAVSLALAGFVLVPLMSAWWAWDGQAGWGPRLLLPGLPAILVLAGVGFAGGARAWRLAGILALVAGAAVNALGALVPFPAVYALSSQVPPQPISEDRAAGTPYEIARETDGTLLATAPHHLSLTPAWSPIRVHALALAARLRGGWDGALPELDPPFRPRMPASAAPALRLALERPRAGIWLSPGADWADPYFDALRDQLVRAIDLKDYERGRRIGEEIERRETGEIPSNDPRVIALVAESLRLGVGSAESSPMRASNAPAALSYLSKKSSSFSSSSMSSFSCHPWILFVRAMAEPPGDLSCLPESQREGFARGLEIARRRGWTLTEWNRAATTGKP
jgi:hypothetical protein